LKCCEKRRGNVIFAFAIKRLKKIEDSKVDIRSHKSKMDRQYNDQKKNNDLHNSTQKTKDLATRTHLKHEVNSGV